MTGPSVRVLHISGKGRSGSTLIGRALGELNGWVAGGELRLIWLAVSAGADRRIGGVGVGTCGCGRPVATCPFWTGVFARMGVDDRLGEVGREVTDLHDRVFRWARIPRLLRAARRLRGGGSTRWPDLDAYTEWMGRLYRSMAAEAGCGVVVDTSKWPADPGALGLVPDVEASVVHLVRDPRAVAYSWQRSKATSPSGVAQMDRFGVVHSSLSWLARNAVVEVASRWSRTPRRLVRYEDFAESPERVLAGIAATVDERAEVHRFIDGSVLDLSGDHTVHGNPDRFSEGAVTVRQDRGWEDGLSARRQRVALLLTSPLAGRYGYRRSAGASPA